MTPTISMMNAKTQKKSAKGNRTKPRNPNTSERTINATPPPVLMGYTGMESHGIFIQECSQRSLKIGVVTTDSKAPSIRISGQRVSRALTTQGSRSSETLGSTFSGRCSTCSFRLGRVAILHDPNLAILTGQVRCDL